MLKIDRQLFLQYLCNNITVEHPIDADRAMREKAMDEEGEDEEEEGRLGTSTSNPHRHPKGRMFTLTAIQNQRTRTFNSMIFGFIFSTQLNL